MTYYDYEILKGKRPYTEMYLGNGWYEYAKSKKFKVGDVFIFHYWSALEMLYVKLVRKQRRRIGESNV